MRTSGPLRASAGNARSGGAASLYMVWISPATSTDCQPAPAMASWMALMASNLPRIASAKAGTLAALCSYRQTSE